MSTGGGCAGSCIYVDEEIADSPDRVARDFLDEHGIYGLAVAAGVLVSVPRAGAISTTQVIQRVLAAPTEAG